VDAHAGIDDRDRASLLDEITVAQSMSPINGAGRGSCFRVSSFVLRASGGRGWPWRMRTAARIGASTSVRPAARALTMLARPFVPHVARASSLATVVHDDWICTRLAPSSLVKRRDTCALTVAPLINKAAATSAFEAPDQSRLPPHVRDR
jgi:hypothetical protein